MNENNQPINSTANKVSKHEVSAKRRALVKGAMGVVPAVLTLRSGAAFALDSSESCVDFDKHQAVSHKPTVISDTYIAPLETAYVRTSTLCRTLDKGAGVKVYQDLETPSTWRDGDYQSGNDAVTETYVNDASGKMKEVSSGTVYDITSNTSCHVLAYMDETGYKTGVIGNATVDNGTLPYITNSCWVSATPTP